MCKLYADDLKLYSVIQMPHHVSALQCGLDALATWSSEWQLTISNTKSSVLYLNPSTVTQSYTINQSSIGLVHEMHDLGVIIDSKLTMSQHVSKIVTKARMRANLIFKCFHSRQRNTLLKAFTTYVRPLLEYASQV